MMQNKCVVKGEKKKTTKRKRDSSPTSESSCGVFAAVNPQILGNFSPGELQNCCSTSSTVSYHQQGWGPWQQRWRRAWGCCAQSGGSAPCGVPRRGEGGWRATRRARQGAETGGWGRCRRWQGCRSEEEAWGGKQRHAVTHSHPEQAQLLATPLRPAPPPSPTREEFKHIVGQSSLLGIHTVWSSQASCGRTPILH